MPTFRDSKSAFGDAIARGTLSVSRDADHYAGDYMYMHSEGARDYFKNRDTRQYISSRAILPIVQDDPQDLISKD